MIGEGRIKFFPSFFLIEKYGKLVRWYCMSDYTYKGDKFYPYNRDNTKQVIP